MQLIKVGSRYINLDNVYQISFNDLDRKNHPEQQIEATLDVITSSSTYDENNSPIEAAGMRVFGQEAEALRYYLDGSSTDVLETYRTQEYDRVPG